MSKWIVLIFVAQIELRLAELVERDLLLTLALSVEDFGDVEHVFH